MEIRETVLFLLEILLDIDDTNAIYICIIEMGWREREMSSNHNYFLFYFQPIYGYSEFIVFTKKEMRV